MPDPITALKRLDDDSMPVPALPPEEVRRRGDRLRLRNRLAVGATAVAVVAAVTSGTYAVVHDRSGSGSHEVPTKHQAELTHTGYHHLSLRMSAAAADGTGDVRLQPSTQGACDTFDLADYGPRANQVDGYLSHRLGVVAIFARPGMTTPEGIELGSTLGETKAAYPDGKMQQGYWVAKLGAGSEYEFGISAGKVTELGLTLSDQDCFG